MRSINSLILYNNDLWSLFLAIAEIKDSKTSNMRPNMKHKEIFIIKCFLILIYKEVTEPIYIQ